MMLNRVISQFDDSAVTRFLVDSIRGARDRFARSRSDQGRPSALPEPEPKPEPYQQQRIGKSLEVHLTEELGYCAPRKVLAIMKRLDADRMRLTDHGLLTPPGRRYTLPVAGTDITATVNWSIV
mmetsp:Transcript_34984/g.82964  ORF Transcript_34984/g.82964 Transcript_34984/m.82964 type:complete len:124 (-) Transcript_34984:280-651(-)